MDILSFLSSETVLRRLSKTCRETLAASCRLKNFTARDVIFFEGDDGENGYVVAEGRVVMVKSSPSGKEFIVELLPRGEFFGVIALLEKRPYPLTAKAQCTASAIEIPRRAVESLTRDFPEVHQLFLSMVAERLWSSQNISRSLAHEKVEVRIASALLAMIPHFALSAEEAPTIVMTRQELGDLTGTTMETATRVTKAMERENIISLETPGHIVIHATERLRSLAEQTIA